MFDDAIVCAPSITMHLQIYHTLPLQTSLCVFKSSSKPPSQPQVFFQVSDHRYYHTIGPNTFPHPNALLLKFLLFLFPSHGAEEPSIKQLSAASWSAGLITLVPTGFAVKSSLKRKTCVCTTAIEPCLYLCTAQQIA